MARVHFLGTGAAISDAHRTTTMLGFEDGGFVVLVDCGGDVVQRAQQAGLAPTGVEAAIITHEHPDHVSGFPLMVQKLWLGGRSGPLPVHGIGPALAQAGRCMGAFDTSGWDGLPPIEWREFAHLAGALVFENERWRITATPGIHSVPNVALRVESVQTAGVCVYSSDTARSEEIAAFAHGANVLIHEATGKYPGHSTAEDAARVAAEAGVKGLYLVHLPPESGLAEPSMEAARRIFPRMWKAEELSYLEF